MNKKTLAFDRTFLLGSTLWVVINLVFGAFTLSAEEKFEEFETEGETYYNVTVTSKTPTHVFITHSKGFANIKVESLTDDLQVQLGYKVAKVEKKAESNLGLEEIPMDPEMAAARDKFLEDFKTQFSGMDRNLLYTLWGAQLVVYLFFCFCCKKICEKAGFKPGLMAWIPGFQMLALFKAARMGSLWFLLYISPLAAPFAIKPIVENLGPQFLALLLIPLGFMLISYLVWCFKICIARGIAPAAGLLLLLPGLNLIMFLYLAFSAGNTKVPVRMSKEDTQRWSKAKAQDTSFFMNS